jgi:hypothetical protein
MKLSRGVENSPKELFNKLSSKYGAPPLRYSSIIIIFEYYGFCLYRKKSRITMDGLSRKLTHFHASTSAFQNVNNPFVHLRRLPTRSSPHTRRVILSMATSDIITFAEVQEVALTRYILKIFPFFHHRFYSLPTISKKFSLCFDFL